MSNPEPAADALLPSWRQLAAELKKVSRRLSLGEDVEGPVPSLGLSLELIPGEYWFFQPGWFNIRWWWDEIITSAAVIRHSLIELEAYYVHELTLETLYVKNARYRRTNAFNNHLTRVRRAKASLIESVVTRLFALREKATWLIYEVLSSLTGVHLAPHQVTYHRVNGVLKSLPKEGTNATTLEALAGIASALNDESIAALFQFRHGYVHRLTPRVGGDIPALLLQIKPGIWDSIGLVKHRCRNIVHLASHTWIRLVTAIRRLAELPLSSTGVMCDVEPRDGTEQRDWWTAVHTGMAVETECGPLFVKCMSECRGFKGVLTPQRHLEATSESVSDWARVIAEAMRACIPLFEPEKYTGHFKFIVSEGVAGQSVAALLTYNKAADPLMISLAQQGARTVRQRFKEAPGSFETQTLTRSELQKLVESDPGFSTWPRKAKRALIDVLSDMEPSSIAVWRGNPGGYESIRRVVVRTDVPLDLSAIHPGRPDQIVVLEARDQLRGD